MKHCKTHFVFRETYLKFCSRTPTCLSSLYICMLASTEISSHNQPNFLTCSFCCVWFFFSFPFLPALESTDRKFNTTAVLIQSSSSILSEAGKQERLWLMFVICGNSGNSQFSSGVINVVLKITQIIRLNFI